MFTRRRLLAASGAALSLTALPFTADAAAVADKDYLLVRPAVPMAGKPVIIHDFFAYTCPHCLTFAPVLEEFVASLPKDGSVKVIPAPVAWNSTYEIFPRTYFAFEALGKVGKPFLRYFFGIAFVCLVRFDLIFEQHKHIAVDNRGEARKEHRNCEFETAVFFKPRETHRNYGNERKPHFFERFTEQKNIV